MDPAIEDNSIKPVNKLRERFEALAVSSSSKLVAHNNHDHDEEPQLAQEAMGASPRLPGLYNLRTVSASSSSISNTPAVFKKSSESDTSNEESSTPVNEMSSSARPGSPTVSRKPALKPPPPPPPDRSGSLRNKASADSVGSAKKSMPALGVYRKPPPPPPSLGSQPGHGASLSVGDLVNQINVSNAPSFRSLDTSPITTPVAIHPLNGLRRSPSPAPPELLNALPPRPAPPPVPPTHPIRISIPESTQPRPIHTNSELNLPRSPIKPTPPPRIPTQLTFTPSTPSTPAPPLPSRTSPDQGGSRNVVIHQSLTKKADGLVASEADEFGVDIRSPPPRHHSLTSRPQSSGPGRPAAPPPPPPPRPTSLISPVLNSSPSIVATGSLIHAPPPLPNRRSNPNLRAEDSPPTPVMTPSASAPPAPPMATRPNPSSSWGKLAASTRSGLLKAQILQDQDNTDFKPPPPPTRTIGLGDKLPPARRLSGDESSDDSDDDGHPGPGANAPGKKYQDDMPDSSQSRRQPPRIPQYPYFHISTGAVVAVSGTWVCVGNLDIGIYNVQDSAAPVHMVDLEHLGLEWRTKEPRVTAMQFRPAENPEDDGRYLWCGTKDGHLFELDIRSGTLMEVLIPAGGHSLTVTHILRHGRAMFTMDESGKIIVFEPPEGHSTPTLSRFTRSHRAADKQSFVSILAGHLWTSSGSGSTSSTHTTRGPPFRTYDISSSTFSTKHLFPTEQVGPALCGAIIPQQPDKVYIGHEGGSVTVWKYDTPSNQYACVQTVKVTNSSIVCMEGVNSRLWFGTRSGTITVCEAREELPWIITNQWQAHGDSPVTHISVDPYSITQVGKLVVYSVGRDDCLRFWDGLLEWNWIDEEMQKRAGQYSTYRDVKVRICTWNIDSQKPDALSGNEENRNFFDNMLKPGDRPDIIVFGFQEVIDLENKKLTAKTVLLGNHKSKTEGKISEKVSRSYKLWYDKLIYFVRLAFGGEEPYNVIHSENLVGLFTCIFVRKPECMSLSDPSITTVKRGMKGRYGNKGAIIARFVLDDTSFCFLNCHLAAGQKHVRERNQDLASILEERSVFPSPVHDMAPAAFVSGGDGSMVLDHEVVFLNGDLNYRIDQRRDVVVSSVQSGDLNFLLSHDQLRKEMDTNPGFRLRNFTEAPITFAPTYKYDRKSKEFDTSEKRRIPAWCDRILYRSRGEHVRCDMYRRYEPDISDHRPVAGAFTVQVKSVRRDAWSATKTQVQEEWQQVQYQLLCAAQEFYTTNGLLI